LNMRGRDVAVFIELLEPFDQLFPERFCHFSPSPTPKMGLQSGNCKAKIRPG
jgi:hypothetical protein